MLGEFSLFKLPYFITAPFTMLAGDYVNLEKSQQSVTFHAAFYGLI